MKSCFVVCPHSIASLVAAFVVTLAAADGIAAEVNAETYKGISLGAIFDAVEAKLGRGQRAATREIPKLTDPAEETALATALRTSRPNLLYKWESGAGRLVIGIQTAETGDVIVFKGFFWKDKDAQKGLFAGK